MGVQLGVIFIIFAASGAGTLVPVVAKHIPRCNANSIVMEATRAFSFGVVLSTGLIHMVNEGIETLSDEALGSIVEEYGCLGLPIVLITMIVLHFIECESVIFFGGEASTVAVTVTRMPAQQDPAPHKSADHTASHSVIVGLDLGVTTGTEFKTLLTALCFHQFFEGVAIGSAALASIKSRKKLFMVNVAFAITTPIGQVIGIGIRNLYSSEATTALWIQGVFDCIAGGILLYTGLVELLTYNMTTNQKFLSRSAS